MNSRFTVEQQLLTDRASAERRSVTRMLAPLTTALLLCSPPATLVAGPLPELRLRLDPRLPDHADVALADTPLHRELAAGDEAPGRYEPRWSARLLMGGALLVADAVLIPIVFEDIIDASFGGDASGLGISLPALLVVPPALASLVGGAPARIAAFAFGVAAHTAAVIAFGLAPPVGFVLELWATPAVMDRVAVASAQAADAERGATAALPVRDPALR